MLNDNWFLIEPRLEKPIDPQYLLWLKIRYILIGRNFEHYDSQKALELARQCSWPEAKWLVSICDKNGGIPSDKEEVKTMFYRNNPETSVLIDSTGIKQNIKNLDPNTIRIAVVQNLFLPGLGQLYQGKKIKGWIFAAASSLTFGGMIYFIFDSKTKENDYLKETNQFLIQQKYDVYNKSYKIRNAIIFSYALIWIYSQVDLLLFHDSQVSTETTINGNYFGLNSMNRDFQLNFQIRF